MSEDEKRDLNRRVAVALGYTVEETHCNPRTDGTTLCYRLMRNGVCAGWSTGVRGWGRHDTPEQAWEIPDFCTSPAAADLVRQEIERRGWIWSIDPGMNDKRYFSYVSGGSPRCSEEPYGMAEGNEWTEALCLAFLAACEAQKTEVKP